MRFKILKPELMDVAHKVHLGVSDKNFALIGIRTLENGILCAHGFDRVVSIYCESPCDVLSKGTAFVSARMFYDVVKEFPKSTVEIYTKGTHLVLTAEGIECSIKIPLVVDVSWQEESSLMSNPETVSIPGAKLAYLIEQVQFCISLDSPRIYGSVGYIHSPRDGVLSLVGTDGYRLSVCSVEIQSTSEVLHQGICVSKRGLAEIQRMCLEGYETISLSFSRDAKVLQASVGNYRIYILLSAVTFPKYESVIDVLPGKEITIDRARLLGVVRRMLLASDKTRTVKIEIENGRIAVSSSSVDHSEGYEQVDVSGDSFRLSLAANGKFLTDIVSSTNTELISLRFKDDESPVLVLPMQEPEGCRSKHILVPIKENV